MSDTLDKLIHVSPRFARSISLARDAHRTDALQGYILTPTGRGVLQRLADALGGDSPTRAWSLTGPYGSGKSAFALFIAQLLGGELPVRQQARAFLEAEDAELCKRLFRQGGAIPRKVGRLCPVLITGSRQPLEKTLASGLAVALRGIAKFGKRHPLVEQLERMAADPASSGTAIVGLFEEANVYLQKFGPEAAGILLIVDELGKFLEYGASNLDRGDIFVLQEMAEAATRSKRPFLFVTVLHQSVDRYAEHMSPSRRAEWAKIQGRFEDVAYEENGEQMLRLLTHAIQQQGTEPELNVLLEQAKASAQEAASLGLRCGSMQSGELQTCLAGCYPLHPLTALVVGPLFRQLAQNERSLFAFLASSEPFGFQEYLRRTTLGDGPYRLDHLYDYLMAALGPTLFAQHRGKLWAEVQSALERLHDATETEFRLAKTIGLLQALGTAAGISAAGSVLHAALHGTASVAEIDEGIRSLTRRSVAVLRRHTASYALWEGSDVDIEERLRAARRSVEKDQNLAAFLSRELPHQPMIARRHYFQKGTLRYFETCYADRASFQGSLFQNDLSRELGSADGRVVFCLPLDPDDRETMRQIICSVPEGPVIAALPQDVFDLRELCHDLVCLRWVSQHTPELEADRTARKELQARMAIAEQNLQTHLDWVFSAANQGRCDWFYPGNFETPGFQEGAFLLM